MNRIEWEFEYGAAELAAAAGEKSLFHEGRVKWWSDRKAAVMSEVRESGIDISESVASEYGKGVSNFTSAGTPQIVVDATLQKKLAECHTKIMEHDRKRLDYDGWRQMLAANSLARLKLHQDDWIFFFGK